jgi:serine/threonine protein kinase
LVRRLLTVESSKRITAAEALQHPWFQFVLFSLSLSLSPLFLIQLFKSFDSVPICCIPFLLMVLTRQNITLHEEFKSEIGVVYIFFLQSFVIAPKRE